MSFCLYSCAHGSFLCVGRRENEFLDVCMEIYRAVTRLLSWKVKTIYERQPRFPFILEYMAEKNIWSQLNENLQIWTDFSWVHPVGNANQQL